MVVLVTGSSGQLGQSLQFIAPNYPQIDFVFCDSKTLDITSLENCETIFSNSIARSASNPASFFHSADP